MLVCNIIEKIDGNPTVGIKCGENRIEWYEINDDSLSRYHGSVVTRFHIEPNFEDNRAINWKSPCRIVIEIEEGKPYISRESMRTLKMIENWLGGK